MTSRDGEAREDQFLVRIMTATSGRFCTDPRDAVYAYLGLYSGDSRDLIRVDYRKTLRKVYRQFVIVALRVNVFWSLTACLSFSISKLPTSPSWVPDLAKQELLSPYSNFKGLDYSRQMFEHENQPTTRLCGRFLYAHGVFLDQIVIDLDT